MQTQEDDASMEASRCDKTSLPEENVTSRRLIGVELLLARRLCSPEEYGYSEWRLVSVEV